MLSWYMYLVRGIYVLGKSICRKSTPRTFIDMGFFNQFSLRFA